MWNLIKHTINKGVVMTQEQKDYLMELISRDAVVDNSALTLKVSSLNITIEALEAQIDKLTADKLIAIGVRNDIMSSINTRNGIAQTLSDTIIV